ncbi:hypothetical protein FQ154_01650 [Paeniglutamicibacter gangotriensis]|uniref:DUF2213 domain-containing protein n=1 Tax=Paeniglutamicibacter gangotriensis TaxID=254787 RepID=A0A5B0EQA0_9MICC|nr:hypothetical protein [Paeniglutamicibacter gangotriensis]KAA0979890.1 hypothetical protein FQ154_01650 [Paeniglutamicibacter gangotriensis]
MSTLIKEAATATRTGPGRVKLVLLTPGKGSSGTYTPEVIQQAATDRVWRRGSQSHINHDTAAERMERPEGNLRNLVGILDEDPYVDTDGALVAEAIIGSAWRDFVDDFKDHIGASIVASAEVSESKDGRIIERLIPSPFNRCDLVTIAGRGGRIAEVIEAAKVIEARSVVTETMANDVEQYLRAAVRDAHRDDEDYAWLQDYDDTNVYFEKLGKIHRQAYSLDGVNVTLSGEPVEVRRRVEYDPINSPATPAGVTEKKEAATMATTQIEEAELATLRESASRAATVEAELAEARTLLAEAETARTKATAEAIVAEAFGDTEAKVTRAALITAALAAEAFDADKLRADATEAAAEIAVTHGAGTPRGVGETAKVTESGKTITSESIVSALHGKAA